MIDDRRIDANDKPVNPDGSHIVYWMTSARRARWNYALDHAIELANEHNVPLIVVECLALGHRWANDRIHTFVLQGMIDNRKLFESSPVTYVPYVETKKAQAGGLMKSFSKDAVAVVIDDFPTYMPRDVAQRAKNLADCSVQCIDSNGIIPLRAPERSFSTAHSFRRYIHQNVLNFVSTPPSANPLNNLTDTGDGSHTLLSVSKMQMFRKHLLSSFGEFPKPRLKAGKHLQSSISIMKFHRSMTVEEVPSRRAQN